MSNQLTVFQKPKDLTEYLDRGREQFARALPSHLKADRLIRLAVTAWSTNPSIRKCSGQSIMASLMVAAQVGLEPGIAGQGYLIPYKDTCTFVPGWQGLVGLLNNSGRATAWTGAVFEGDEWDFQLGSAPVCRHVPGPNYGDPEKMIWVYACGKVNGSEQPVVEAWPMARVWRHRDRFNKVGQKHYSFQHPEMYARKVVLLQVLKYMPRSIELNNAIVASDAAEIGRATNVQEGIVIEMPENDIPAANVGSSRENATPLEDAKPAKQAKPAQTSPQAEEEQSQEPQTRAEDVSQEQPTDAQQETATAQQLLAELMPKRSELGLSLPDLNKILVKLGLLEEGKSFKDASAEVLQQIKDRWQEVEENA